MQKCDSFNKREEGHTVNATQLNKEVEQAFYLACKRGIYKELKQKNLITDVQLNQLLGQLE